MVRIKIKINNIICSKQLKSLNEGLNNYYEFKK